MIVDVNGRVQEVNASKATNLWLDNNTQLNINVHTRQILGAVTNYNFTEIQINNQVAPPTMLVTKPITVNIIFSNQQKTQSSITLDVTPASTTTGNTVKISGSLSANRANSNSSTVDLSFSNDTVKWEPMTNVTTGQGGTFSYSWTPNVPGSYLVRAYWPGNTQQVASTEITSVNVQSTVPTNLGGSNNQPNPILELPKVMNGGVMNGGPLISLPLDLARSLLVLGTLFAGLLIPGAVPVIGYFIGSVLAGFVFVFPISVLVLAFRAARNQRSPSVIWLTPLLTIWIATFAILIASRMSPVVPQALLEASTTLLLASNALLVPLGFSLIVARAVAS